MRTSSEDLNGLSTVTWHESFKPYVPPDHFGPVPRAKAPSACRELAARLRREANARLSENEAWFSIPDELRTLLVCLCTEREPARAHMLRWSDLTDVERTTIGVQARSFVRGLSKVAGVLR